MTGSGMEAQQVIPDHVNFTWDNPFFRRGVFQSEGGRPDWFSREITQGCNLATMARAYCSLTMPVG